MSTTAAALTPWIRTLLAAPTAAESGLKLEDYLAKIPRLASLGDVPSGTPVLVRGDVDAKPGPTVGDGDIRLRSMVETLEFGRSRGWKQIVFGHIGRKPEGSLNKVAKRLGELLKCDVPLVADWFDDATCTVLESAAATIRAAAPGSVIVLENTRKYEIERVLWTAKPDDAAKHAEKLARYAEELATKVATVYVNEALSAGSMDSSSTIAPAAMKRVALGAYVAHEFDQPMQRCLEATAVVFSGLKTDKLNDLEAMIDRGRIRWVFTAGSLAMSLKKADAELAGRPFSLGLSENPEHADKPYYISREAIDQAKRMIAEGRKKNIRFVMPVDFVLGDGRVVDELGPADQQFDVGPKTSEHFAAKIGEFIDDARQAAGRPVLFYNGVFGMFEDPRFESGTKAFVQQLKRLTDAGVEVYVGGGEGGAAVEKYGRPDFIKHCFTAGGTVLNALGSAPVPYLQALMMAATK